MSTEDKQNEQAQEQEQDQEKAIKAALKAGSLIKIKVDKEVVIIEPILTEDKVDALAKKLDDLIKLPKLAEMVDGLILKLGFTYLNKNFSHLASKPLKAAIVMAVDGFLEDDISKLVAAAPKAIQGIVNLPQLDDDLEGKFFAINIQALFQFMQFYIAKAKAKKAAKK